MDNISSEQLEIFKSLEKRIRQRYARRTELISHLIAFVISIPVMWLVISWWMPDVVFWKILGALVTGGWTIGILIHIVQTTGQELEDRAVMREMERFGLLNEFKRKRDEQTSMDQLIGLGNDGELVELGFDEVEEQHSHYG